MNRVLMGAIALVLLSVILGCFVTFGMNCVLGNVCLSAILPVPLYPVGTIILTLLTLFSAIERSSTTLRSQFLTVPKTINEEPTRKIAIYLSKQTFLL